MLKRKHSITNILLDSFLLKQQKLCNILNIPNTTTPQWFSEFHPQQRREKTVYKLVLCTWKAVFITRTSLEATAAAHRSTYRTSHRTADNLPAWEQHGSPAWPEVCCWTGFFQWQRSRLQTWGCSDTVFEQVFLFLTSPSYHQSHAKALLSDKWSHTQVIFSFSSRSQRNFDYPFISQHVSLCHLANLTSITCF